MRFSPVLLGIAMGAVLLGCNKKSEGDVSPETKPARSAAQSGSLIGSDSVPTLAALADTVWARAQRGDTTGLVRLMVDDSLFRREIFPLSDAYDSSRQDVFELVRGLDKVASVRGLKRLLFGATAVGSVRPAPSTFNVETTPSGYRLHAIPRGAKGGNHLFGAALCTPTGCRVGTFAGADLQADSED